MSLERFIKNPIGGRTEAVCAHLLHGYSRFTITLLYPFLSRPIYAHGDKYASRAKHCACVRDIVCFLVHAAESSSPVIPSSRLFRSENIAMHGVGVEQEQDIGRRSERLCAL